MKQKSAWIVAFVLVCAGVPAQATTVEIEAARVRSGYNDVAIPGDSGTRLSLTDDLHADDANAYRFRLGHRFAERHWVGVLAAPLEVESHGTLEQDTVFDDATFAAGTRADAKFRFDSYRVLYRYAWYRSERWQVELGGAAKVRDAAITLRGGGTEARKSNVGVVPLLSFNVTWTPAPRWHLLADGEALAAPQGRAEDVLFAVQYDVHPRLALRAGYRLLEGGADNDEVYTFSLFHYATVGAVLSF